MDKYSQHDLKQFVHFASKYNTGKYAGGEGWTKLAYDLLAIFDCQGLPGAIVNYLITKEDVDTLTNVDAETTHDAMNQATKAVAELSDAYKELVVKAEDARQSLATSAQVLRRRSQMNIQPPLSPIPSAGAGAAPRDEALGDDYRSSARQPVPEAAGRRPPPQDNDLHKRRAADRRDGEGHHQDADVGEAKADGPLGADLPENEQHARQYRSSDPRPEIATARGGRRHEERAHDLPDGVGQHQDDDAARHDGEEHQQDDDDDGQVYIANLTAEDKIAIDEAMECKENLKNLRNEREWVLGQLKIAQEQLKIAQTHHTSAETMAKDAKTINTLLNNVRSLDDFLKLNRTTRKSLYDKANSNIARTMTMVLGADHRALLDDVDGEDGMAIWEMLHTENEENCPDPVGRKLDEIRALAQDNDGMGPRQCTYHFNNVKVHCISLIHMMNRVRRARIDGGGLRVNSPGAILKMPHEHIPALEGLLSLKGKQTVRCTQETAYMLESTALPRLYHGLAR